MDEAPHYAFPHSAEDESRRLGLFQQRLDPLTIRRIERLGIGRGATCLEVGGGRGSITSWLADLVGTDGRVTATDLQTGFLDTIDAPNVEVLSHDVRTDGFPEQSFDLVHTRAVLMHIPDDLEVLRRMVSWLRPGGWLLLEEPDFGMWLADADPVWATHPDAWHRTFPAGSLSRGRSLLRQIRQLALVDVGADAEADIIESGSPLAEFYSLSMAAVDRPRSQPARSPRQRRPRWSTGRTPPISSVADSSTSASGAVARRASCGRSFGHGGAAAERAQAKLAAKILQLVRIVALAELIGLAANQTRPNPPLAAGHAEADPSCVEEPVIERAKVVVLLFNVSDIASSLHRIEHLVGEDAGEEEADES